MGRVVLDEAAAVEHAGHLPNIGVVAARSSVDGVVVVLEHIHVETTEGADVRSSVSPKEEAATILIPLTNTRSSVHDNFGHLPYGAVVVEVAHPPEHAVRLEYVGRSDAAEWNEGAGWIGLVEPEPSRSIVVVTIGDELFRSIEYREIADSGLADAEAAGSGERTAFVVFGGKGNGPSLALNDVLDGVVGHVGHEGLVDGAVGTIGGYEVSRGCCWVRIPLNVSVIAAHLFELAHLDATETCSARTGVVKDNALREVGAIGIFEHVAVGHVGLDSIVGIGAASDNLCARLGAVGIAGHLHVLVAGGPGNDVVVTLQAGLDAGSIGFAENRGNDVVIHIGVAGTECCDSSDSCENISEFHIELFFFGLIGVFGVI